MTVCMCAHACATCQPVCAARGSLSRLQVRYLVPAPHSRWELDQRQAGPWHSRGKTRFHFLAGPPPADGSGAAASGEGPGGEGASSGTASGGGLRPNDMCGGEGEGEGGSDMQGYRSEYQRLVEDLPDVELAVIQHHTDEVKPMGL